MKTSHRCPKCGHGTVLHIAEVADQKDVHDSTHSEPMKIARVTRVSKLSHIEMIRAESFGELEACVCKACGFAELYVKDPGSIPVDGKSVTELSAED